MSVMLISVSHDTIVSNKHEEKTRHYYVDFQQASPDPFSKSNWSLDPLSEATKQTIH